METAPKLVLVTGGTGYLASHLINELLKRKIRIRTTVRSIKDKSKYAHLFSLSPDAKELLEFVEADITKEQGWDEAVKGCDTVFHLASPFPNIVPKDESLVIRPAVQGTLNVLNACVRNGVRKVILTSSIAAVMMGNEKTCCSEENWSVESACPPYEKSKLLAEEAAWKFYYQNKDKIEFTVLCPGLLWGPIFNKNTFTSGEFIQLMMSGTLPAVPVLSFPISDVRDTALAHIRAMERKETNGQRYIIVGEVIKVERCIQLLRKEFSQYGYRFPPNIRVGKVLTAAASIINPMYKLFIPSIGVLYQISNKKSVEELGLEYHPIESCVVETAYSMIDNKILPDKRPKAKL